MTLFFFTYGLPALLGYTLFIGISGKYNFFRTPSVLEERPPWFLGIWTGLSVFLVISLGLHIAYGLSLEQGRAIALPSVILLGSSLLLGFIAYFLYRSKINTLIKEIDQTPTEQEESAIDWNVKAEQLDSILTPVFPDFTNESTQEMFAGVSHDNARENTFIPETATADQLRDELAAERALRLETEQHLRITRRALASQEGVASTQSTDGSSPEVVFLDNLAANSARTTETIVPISFENMELTIANLRRDLVKARHDIRNHVAARAKALSTANKSVAFARQSIELRAKLERELNLVQSTLANRQSTIASLVDKLETGRRLSNEELEALTHRHAINDSDLHNARGSENSVSFDTARYSGGF